MPGSSTEVRLAGPGDAADLATLLADYLRERHPDHRGTTEAELRRDVLTPNGQRVHLAIRADAAAGFVAWDPVYDMHWAAKGAQIADLYVVPQHRGVGVALELIAAVCATAAADGAGFLRASGYDRTSSVGKFYERIALGFDTAECHCSGKAFRRMVELHGMPARSMVRALPRPDWNLTA